jgi:glyoxylase-like metal-dependent hydrolase (beta-lactamase superfamily II)
MPTLADGGFIPFFYFRPEVLTGGRMALQIQTIVSQPFAENTYVVWREGSANAIVIDPGTEPDLILQFLADRGLTPVVILNTHGHSDHIAGNASLKEAFPKAPIVIGSGDAPMLADPDLNLSRPFGFDLISPPADQVVCEGDDVLFAGVPMHIREIPGHSPGHVVFILGDEGIVFGGDVLFRGSIGRTDFPRGSVEALEKGIREKLYTLPDETVVYPGHGPVTKIGHEKRTNSYVREK